MESIPKPVEFEIETMIIRHPPANDASAPIIELFNRIIIDHVNHVPNDAFVADLAALHASVSVQGDHYVWCCTCGLPACAGIAVPVTVSHMHALVCWQIRDVPGVPDMVCAFQAGQYRDVIRKAIDETKRLYDLNTQDGTKVDIYPDPLFTGLLPLIQ